MPSRTEISRRVRIPGGAALVLLGLPAGSGLAENLLKNPGFEEQGYWNAYLYAFTRNLWRSHDGGHYNAALMGQWADKPKGGVIDRRIWADRSFHGMIEQRDIPVEPGVIYVLRAWVWGDPGWLPEEQYLEITFHDREGFILDTAVEQLPTIHPVWTPVECRAQAPAKAAFATVAIGVRNVPVYGALTIDDMYFGPADAGPKPE